MHCSESLSCLSSTVMMEELVQRDNRSDFFHILLSHSELANYNIISTSSYRSPLSHALSNTLSNKRGACSI